MIPSIGSTLSALVDPVALLLVLLVLAAGLCVQRRNWLGTTILTALAILIEVTLGTSLPRHLIGELEAPYSPDRQPLPARADAIVMLGGAHNFSHREALQIGFIEASDRIMTSIELLRQGRAGTLVLCTASQAEMNGRPVADSELIERLIDRWNLRKGSQIIRLPVCGNTADEAREVAALASRRGWKQVLLVSSGFHLRRAEAAFKKAGMEGVIPVGCDLRGIFPGEPDHNPIGLPRTESATILKMWLHEQVGWWYYGVRGWR